MADKHGNLWVWIKEEAVNVESKVNDDDGNDVIDNDNDDDEEDEEKDGDYEC